MNREVQLKIQAYLDGELNTTDCQLVDKWLKTNSDAADLLKDLSLMRQCLKQNELQHSLPVPSDFYWSQIQREISSDKNGLVELRNPSWMHWFWKALAPLGVAALLALLISPNLSPKPGSVMALNNGMEVQTETSDAMVITYRSDSEGVSVVWIQTP